MPKPSMIAGVAVATIAFAGFVSYMHSAGVAMLDRAAARQCLEQDWPAHQAPAHQAWCQQEGYPLGQ